MQASVRRKAPFRPLLLAGGVIVALGVAGWVAMVSTLNPERLRDALQDAVQRATGRELTIAGGVHLGLGLAPQFEVEDIALANLAGGSRPNMITAKRLRARLALLPLLSGDAEIASVTVEQPDLLLERSADGTPNWQFTPEHRALYQGRPGQAGSGSGNSGGHRIDIRSIKLEGGRISWRPWQGQTVTLDVGQLTVSAARLEAPMSLSFEGMDGSVPISLTASAGSLGRLEGGPVGALAGTWPLTVDAAAAGATLHVEGGINHPEQIRSYQFRVTAHAPSLDALNALWPSLQLPPMAEINATALLSDGSQGELRTSQVSVHAGASDLSRWVPGLTVKQSVLSAPGPGQLMQLSLDGNYQNQPLRLAVAAMQPDVVGGGGPLQVTASASAAGASLSAHGTIPPGLNATGLDLEVNARAPDLAALSPFVGRSLPPAHDLTLDAQLGDAGVKLRGIAVRNLALNSSLGDLAGQVTVNWAPRFSLDGTLTSRSLNLDAVLPGLASGSKLPGTWPPSESGAVQAVMPAESAGAPPVEAVPITPSLRGGLPLGLLRSADANLTLSAEDVTLGGGQYRDLQAQLQLADGKLALNPFRAQGPEGAIVGGLSIDASSDLPPVAVTLRSPSISAGAVANLLGYPGGASGTMQVDAQLSGVGQSVQALQASLDGHIGMAMVNGQIQDSLLQGLIGEALDTAGVASFTAGSSQLRCLALLVDFRGGIGRVQALAADTSKLMLDGDGQVDLRSGTVDLHLRPRVRLGPTEVAAPVSLRGPFDAMKASLDPVLGGGRVGLSIGGAPAGPSDCMNKLTVARNGLDGPMPAAVPAADGLLRIRKPKDLLKGLFH